MIKVVDSGEEEFALLEGDTESVHHDEDLADPRQGQSQGSVRYTFAQVPLQVQGKRLTNYQSLVQHNRISLKLYIAARSI